MSKALPTLLLDTVSWDLCLNTSGNIAMASPPYSLAQDAASAIRLFAGELWYNTSLGIPYFSQVLGKQPSLPYLKSQFVAAALRVPGVVSAVCYITGFSTATRLLTGQVQITDVNGQTSVASF